MVRCLGLGMVMSGAGAGWRASSSQRGQYIVTGLATEIGSCCVWDFPVFGTVNKDVVNSNFQGVNPF